MRGFLGVIVSFGGLLLAIAFTFAFEKSQSIIIELSIFVLQLTIYLFSIQYFRYKNNMRVVQI